MTTPRKKALITGITGQDGSYLAELLLQKGYEVHSIVRRISSPNFTRIDHLRTEANADKLFLHWGDLTDATSVERIIDICQPEEVYNLAAQSDVRLSFDIPESTANIDALGALRVLEALRRFNPKARFYQASTSELYGKVHEIPQSETTPFHPRSPYGVAKIYAYWATVNYRESYNMYACNGILFNHESPRRGENFVTRKITKAVANIVAGKQKKLFLGNIEAKRDWGYTKDFVEGMWLMLQQDKPDDFVLATGRTQTVREFLEASFGFVNLRWQDYVEIDPKLYRPAEVDILLGNPAKAKKILGWEAKTDYKELAKIMVDADLRAQGLPGIIEGATEKALA